MLKSTQVLKIRLSPDGRGTEFYLEERLPNNTLFSISNVVAHPRARFDEFSLDLMIHIIVAMKQTMKTMTFGSLYGMSAEKLQQNLRS